MTRWVSAAVVLALGSSAACAGIDGEPSPAVTVRLVHPEDQCARLLALFEGARAPHPAAALSAWKRATGGRLSLSKRSEALIAICNPDMVREWRTLDGAELVLGCDPTDGRLRWFATVPRDDGTFAALASAIALTDGATEPPLGDVAVDRLGRAGSPLMARVGRAAVAAGTRNDLQAALDRTHAAPAAWPAIDSGALVRLDPDALGNLGSLLRRRLAEGLRAAGCGRVDGSVRLDGDTVRVGLAGKFASSAPGAAGRPLEPGWLDWIPASPRLAAAFAVAIDSRPEAWDAAFALADRVEKADAALTGVAPMRTRLNLMTAPAGVRLEADFWPKLVGVSGAVFTNPSGQPEGALLALHTTDAAAADRIARRILPSLTTTFRLKRPDNQPNVAAPAPEAVIPLGQRDGRPLSATSRGATVLVSWGDVLTASLEAKAHPEQSAGPTIRASWGERTPHRAGAFWPGRLGMSIQGSPLTDALNASGPIAWIGQSDARSTRDDIQWPGLRSAVLRFLEKIPLDAPPAAPPSP
jgi:hypothetical protein